MVSLLVCENGGKKETFNCCTITQPEYREQRAHSEFCVSGLCWCVMITVGPGQQDVCRWNIVLLRSTMYFTLLKLCQHPSLCPSLCWGQKACCIAAAHWSLIICFLWLWSFRTQAFEVSVLHSVVQQGIGSLTIPFSIQLFCGCSSHKKNQTILPTLPAWGKHCH